MSRRWLPFLGIVAGVSLAGLLAASPVLHEYFDSAAIPPSGPREAIAEGPGEILPSGVADAPRSSDPGPHASPDPGHYRLDSDTSRPQSVGYSDPFTPAIPPFKRQFAYDAVNERLELVVAEPALRRLTIGGKPRSDDDQFFGEIDLAPAADRPFRIPSVGPAARVIGARTEPPGAFALWFDSAENWFVQTRDGAPTRLVVHLAIDRATFGSPFGATTWERLEAYLPPRPAMLRSVANPVLGELSLSQATAPADAVSRLVGHFRSFAPSDERFVEQGERLYQKIALGKVGVCRHRSFAFVVTALALGLPSRFVHNEAHAWVEVFDARLWHRIDLGGAASDMLVGGVLDVPHVAPDDPLPWPANSEAATDMVDGAAATGAGADSSSAVRSSDEQGDAVTATEPNDPAASSASADPSLAPTAAPVASQPAETESAGAESGSEQQDEPASALLPSAGEVDPDVKVSIFADGEQAMRGGRFLLKGRVKSPSADCGLVRVNVLLRDGRGRPVPIGALVTDASGQFEGEVAVPLNVPVGDYELLVSTGPGSCGPASSVAD